MLEPSYIYIFFNHSFDKIYILLTSCQTSWLNGRGQKRGEQDTQDYAGPSYQE